VDTIFLDAYDEAIILFNVTSALRTHKFLRDIVVRFSYHKERSLHFSNKYQDFLKIKFTLAWEDGFQYSQYPEYTVRCVCTRINSLRGRNQWGRCEGGEVSICHQLRFRGPRILERGGGRGRDVTLLIQD
jgi:hypothetical protein